MTAPQMSRCDQGHKGGTAANHAMSGGVNTRWVDVFGLGLVGGQRF